MRQETLEMQTCGDLFPIHTLDDMGGESVLGESETSLIDALLTGPIHEALPMHPSPGASSIPAEWRYLSGSTQGSRQRRKSQTFVDPQLLESVTQGNGSKMLKHTLSEPDLQAAVSRPPSGPSSSSGCTTPPRTPSIVVMRPWSATFPVTPTRYIVGVVEFRKSNTPSPRDSATCAEPTTFFTPQPHKHSRVERHGRFTVIDLDDSVDSSFLPGSDLFLQRRTLSAPETHTACCDCA